MVAPLDLALPFPDDWTPEQFARVSEIAAELAAPLPPGYRATTSIREAFGLAPWPVWRGSEKAPVKWVPIQKAQARKWFEKAERWARLEALPGQGRAALEVLRALMFRFLNWKSGRLDPAYETIAKACRYKRSAVAEALKALHRLGIITWRRRCHATTGKDGRFALEQETNAYVILPPSQWVGFKDEQPAPPPPEPDTWGAAPEVPEVVEQIATAVTEGASLRTKLGLAEIDPADPFAATLARHYRRQLDPPE